MLRSLRISLGFLLVGMTLLTACKLSPPLEDDFDFPDVFVDNFNGLEDRVWRTWIQHGGVEPRTRAGKLQLSANDAGFGVARSFVRMLKKGFYQNFEARIKVNSQVDESRAELILGYAEGAENPDQVTARWRVSYNEGERRWDVQPLILDEDLAALASGPTTTVEAGTYADYRVELDPLRGTVTWRIDGDLFWQTTRSDMRLSSAGGPEIGCFIGGFVEVDSARAERVDNTASMTFDQVRAADRAPRRVETLFSLRDVNDSPVVITRERLPVDLQAEVLEDGEPLDLAESRVYLRGAEDLDLDLVLVLDYTESMRAAGGGTGIDTMKEAARRLIFDRPDHHRIAVVEFHDNQGGDNFSTLISFTTDQNAVWQAVRDYEPFHGFSSAWDAVDSGLELFPATPDPSRVSVLAFLSDGFDTSSTSTPQTIIDKAIARAVSIFNVGVEAVRGVDELELERISEETGGRYFHAAVIGDLLDRFEDIDQELAGQYKAAYVTPRSANFELTLWATANGVRVLAPVVRTVDVAAIDGDTREGLLEVGPVEQDGTNAEFSFSAVHTPRTIDRVRFRFDVSATALSQSDIVVTIDDNGPLAGWSLTQDAGDWWDATGPMAGFGDFGQTFDVTINGVGAGGFDLPFTFDNSLYSNGVLLFGGDPAELIGGDWESIVSIP